MDSNSLLTFTRGAAKTLKRKNCPPPAAEVDTEMHDVTDAVGHPPTPPPPSPPPTADELLEMAGLRSSTDESLQDFNEPSQELQAPPESASV